jgi:predicted enzyme related to lactoylglutathione lyase
MKPIYFDLSVRDLDAARYFFADVFGWRFDKFPMSYEYYRVSAGAAGEPGIDGGIGATNDAPITEGRPTTLITMQVANLDEFLAKVEHAGGRIVEPKQAIPGIGWYATCAEPGGLMFGMIQEDAQAH